MIAALDIGDLASVIASVTTIVLVALTYATVRSSRISADAAAASAQLAQQQLQEAHRPLLIPEDPREENGETIVPVRNIGIGPALRIYGRARVARAGRPPRSQRDGHSDAPDPFALGVIPGAAAGEVVALRFNIFNVPVGRLVGLKITYADATGRQYTSDAHYDGLRTGGFAHVRVTEDDRVRVPVSIRVDPPPPGSPPGSAARITVDRPESAAIPPEDGGDSGTPDR